MTNKNQTIIKIYESFPPLYKGRLGRDLGERGEGQNI
jgi:hypothetical protein